MLKKKKNNWKFDPKHSEQWRLLNRDGSFNIAREGLHRSFVRDAYHSMLSLPWWAFMLITSFCFYAINFIFAIAYLLCGSDAIKGISTEDSFHRLMDAFFFSIQTFSTIAYGNLTPNGIPANLLVSLEALVAIIALAFLTGLVFSRFSKPTARVVFSNNAVINHHEGVESFIFRMANERLNQIVDANVTVVVSLSEKTAEGETYRSFYDMRVERARSPIFAMTWTIVHPIERDSPIFGKTKQDLIDAEAEIIVSLVGMDETFAQTIHARFSYVPFEILWDHGYEDMLQRKTDHHGQRVHVDISKIHHTRPLNTGHLIGKTT